ncbi:MAG: phage major capsid protein [Alphaproteobacteria bacterium]|nr:phage major capsid protein [Alphaproteobacteria bacterium]
MEYETGAALPPIETKALPEGAAQSSRDLLDAFDEFLGTFEAFKAANDERLAEIEKRVSADVVTEEKVDRINRALSEYKARTDEMALSLRRPAIGAPAAKGRGLEPRDRDHAAAFDHYVRKGETAGLSSLEVKSLSTSSDPDGGYLVPRETEAMIERVLRQVSPIRAIASVRQIASASLKKPTSLGTLGSGWVGETAARPETAASTLSVVEFPTMELYAMPAATQSLLDDALINVDEWLAEEIQHEFAAQEGAAFVGGDGIAKPRGFLSYETVANASYAWGKIGYIASGNAGAFGSPNPSDRLIDLVYAPKQIYRQNASWVMNRSVEASVRKLKDGQGNYLWQPAAAAGQPATLLGYPVIEAEDMPDLAPNALSIAFGDFARGYLIVDRAGVRVLRDPFTAKPFVLFYTTKRVGGGVQNFEAIKLMKFAST